MSEVDWPLKAPPTGQHLVQQAAERPDVAALVDGLSARLLGAHVRRGSHDRALLSRRAQLLGSSGVREADVAGRLRRGGILDLAQAEIEHLDAPIRGEFDVGGLEVAMDDALRVGFFERLGDLQGNLTGGPRLERSPLQSLLQRLALDQLENQEGAPVDDLDSVDRCDVRVAQRGEQLRLASKSA